MFECACRVWTGPRSTVLEVIADATDHALDVLSGRVQLWIKRTSPQSGVFLVRNDPSSRGTDGDDGNATLYLPSEDLRCFSAYSPSPLSTTVLVSIDVGESLQQCYFFDSLTRLLQSERQPDDRGRDLYTVGSIETATAFLTVLHEWFADVPLTTSARELLSCATIQKAAHTNATVQDKRPGASIRAKRRKTLTASTFYGRNGAVSAMTMALPTPVSEHADESESTWKRFYEGLQFRVSTSFLCQLEGTAAVSSVFPRQQEAFEFVDQIRAFRQRMWRRYHVQDDIQLEEPRVFSFEDAREGTRRFLVSSFESFWENYMSTKPDHRHVYEIIREGVPCRLYFDLDNIHAGNFIREFVHDLVENPHEQVDEINDASPFHVSTGQQRPLNDGHPESNNTDNLSTKQLFIDVGVYTRNRMFRVLGSSKYRRDAILKPMPTIQNQATATTTAAGNDWLDRNLFLQTLQKSNLILGFCIATQSTRPQGLMENDDRQLDAFILTIANTGGVQGEIRAIHILFDNVDNVVLPSDNPNDDFPQNEELHQQKAKQPWMIIYQMARNRWCWNVRRAHKSNNVMFVVDLDQRVVYQKCHDQQCKTIDYRSPPQTLPPDLLLES
ncbi:DNA primase, ul52/ul70 type, herpesviridae, partial [Globisporangium splendens]